MSSNRIQDKMLQNDNQHTYNNTTLPERKEASRSIMKERARRPDKQIYIPRALRGATLSNTVNSKSDDNHKILNKNEHCIVRSSAKCSSSVKSKSAVKQRCDSSVVMTSRNECCVKSENLKSSEANKCQNLIMNGVDIILQEIAVEEVSTKQESNVNSLYVQEENCNEQLFQISHSESLLPEDQLNNSHFVGDESKLQQIVQLDNKEDFSKQKNYCESEILESSTQNEIMEQKITNDNENSIKQICNAENCVQAAVSNPYKHNEKSDVHCCDKNKEHCVCDNFCVLPNDLKELENNETKYEAHFSEVACDNTSRISKSELDFHDTKNEGSCSDSTLPLKQHEIVKTNVPVIDLPSEESVFEKEADSWETMFTDDGECLNPEILSKLCDTGSMKVNIPNHSYSESSRNESEEYENVVELFGFPVEFSTQDLISAFSVFQRASYIIKWVDDCHALGIFTSPAIANQALQLNHPFIKVRPLSEGIQESKAKARLCSGMAEAHKVRPVTSASLARRLVSGALGLKVHATKEKREMEAKVLKQAKEQKKLKAKQKQDIWDGIVS